MTDASDARELLGAHDPPPVVILRPDAGSPWLLVCEHAGRAVPAALGDLGLEPGEMDRHIAYDLGAEGLVRALCERLDATAVLQPYSRLVIDCNRPTGAPDLVPPASDGTAIPANAAAGEAGRAARLAAIHAPFHAAVAGILQRRSPSTALVAVHSFTPRLAGGPPRPWHAGFCCNRDPRLALALLAETARLAPALRLALNEPYPVDDASDYTIPVHGELPGRPHVLIEVRHDLIADAAGQARWAGLLATAFGRVDWEEMQV